MLRRTVCVGQPAYIYLQNHQLLIRYPDEEHVAGRIPVEDVGLLILDHPRITLTAAAVDACMQKSVAVVYCDAKHLPNGLMLPLQGHCELSSRWQYQVAASTPLKKQLWKQTVAAKIANQRDLLEELAQPIDRMNDFLAEIQAGDHTNREAHAARYY